MANPLTNEDFRKLVSTPRPDIQPQPQHKATISVQQKQQAANTTETYYESLGYRDRALERRKGATQLRADREEEVKGLDVELLGRVRSELANKEEKQQDTVGEAENESVKFHSRLARSVYSFLFDGAKKPKTAVGIGKMSFAYDLDGADPLPTILYRSEECSSLSTRLRTSVVDAVLLRQLSDVLHYSGTIKSPQSENKKDAQPEPLRLPTREDDEDDIFEDAGRDYVAERRAVASRVKRTSYFGENLPTEQEQEQLAEEEKRKKKEQIRRKLLLEEQADDGYAECYPWGPGTNMDDFGSDDDRDAKKPTEHVVRKAATKLKGKEDQKVEKELQKIEKIMEDKGYRHSISKAGEGEEATIVIRKKRRI